MGFKDGFELHKFIYAEVSSRIEEFGFKKRKDHVFTLDISNETLGRIIFNCSIQGGNLVTFTPIIGIKHQAVETLLAALEGKDSDPYSPSTISCDMERITNHKSIKTWNFTVNEDAAEVVQRTKKMMEVIRESGVPFINNYSSLAKIIEVLPKISTEESIAYRLPIALLLSGKKSWAIEALNGVLRTIEEESYPTALDYKEYAMAFEQYCQTGIMPSPAERTVIERHKISNKELAKTLRNILTGCMLEKGFKKRKQDWYTCQISQEATGVVAFSFVSRRNEAISIGPHIGLRHDALERLIKVIRGEKPDEYVSRTINTNIGYLMPKYRYLEWNFFYTENEEAWRKRIGDMVSTIEEYGLPFMRENATLEAIIQNIESKKAYNTRLPYTVPVIYLLLGDEARAEEMLQDYLSRDNVHRSGIMEKDYRQFVENFRDYAKAAE